MKTPYKVDELKWFANKISGMWIACAYIDRDDVRMIFSITRGKKMRPTLRETMTKAIHRIESGECSEVPTK